MEIIQEFDIDTLLAQIAKQELICLQDVVKRYSFVTGRKLDFEKITRMTFDNEPNYWQYHYDGVFLMDRRVFVDNMGQPKLNITFNPSLL